MEQYRGLIDEVLSGAGINYREGLRSEADAQKLSRWVAANPNHPLSKYVASRQGNVYEGLAQLRAGSEGLRTGQENPNFRQAFGVPAEGAVDPNAPPDPNEQARGDLTKWITEFTQSLGRPLDMNDPVFASLSNMGAARASQGVGQSGIRVGRGGLGELAIQQGAMNAAMPYAQQRQQMYQQGLNTLNQRDQGLEGLRQGAYGLNLQQQDMQNRVNAQQYGQQADSAGGTGAAVGGFLGALGTAGLAAIPGVGPALATAAGPGLISGGSKLGSGFGMQSVRPPTYTAPRPYGSFGGRGGSGGYT